MNFFRRKKAAPGGIPKSESSPLYLIALEPRIVYDAAGLATIADDGVSKEPVAADLHHDTHPHDSFESGLGQTLAVFKSFAAPATEFPGHEPAISAPVDAPPPDPTAILFVDSRVENYQQLTGGLDAGVKVVVLSASEDGLNQITRELSMRENLDAVHIVSHGESGKLQLGSTELNLDSLNARTEHFRLWSTAMNEKADILLYGCDVAAGSDGQSFVQRLSELTGADVAASTDKTGAAALGGDWDLEEKSGMVEAGVFAGKAAQAAWQGTLDSLKLVSADSVGGAADNHSDENSISSGGRFVAFRSSSPDLVNNDTNNRIDIFVYDRENGQTARVSVHSDGTQADADCDNPSISADGRFVVFDSAATNLVSGDTNNASDVFLHDRVTGQTTRISVDSSGNQVNGASRAGSISQDNRFVVFESTATNLIGVGNDNNANSDIFIRDRVTNQTTRVSVDSNGVEANGGSTNAKISADGKFVAFLSTADNLLVGETDDNTARDVFVRDLANNQTTRVSVDSDEIQANAASSSLDISDDGRFVAFSSTASNLVTGDTNGLEDVFVRDRVEGDTYLVSKTGAALGNGASSMPAISAGGRFVAYHSFASNLVADDTNGNADVFIYDQVTGETSRVSVNVTGDEGDSASWLPSLSSDGRYVAFYSGANNLTADATNAFNDVFLLDRNDAPKVNTFGKSTLNAILENSAPGQGTAVGDILWPVFLDTDMEHYYSVTGMAVTGVDNANGIWQYSVDYGASWIPFAGLSDTTATLLSGEVRVTTQPITSTMDIAASEIFVNSEATTAIILNNPLQNGLNMKGAWNTMEAINNLDQKLDAEVSTLYCSNVAATIGTSTNVEFRLNGQSVSFSTNGGTVSQVLTDTINAINAQIDNTDVIAYAGNGINGGITDSIVLRNVEPGNKRPISITDYSEAGGTAHTGLANIFQQADSTHNTGEVTFFSLGGFLFSTNTNNDSILNRIGLGGGSANTGQPEDVAGDGKLFVCSGPDRIRFVPNTNFSGTAEISFKLWDQSDYDKNNGETNINASVGGGSTEFSTTSATASITVNPLTAENIVSAGPEFRVNTTTTNSQWEPSVTKLSGGGFVVTWISNMQDGDSAGIFGQRYDAGGNAVGGEFQVNTTSAAAQMDPDIVGLSNGGFVVTWSSWGGQDGALSGIYGQRYDASGNAVGGEFGINTCTASDQIQSSVTSLTNGGFVVTWASLSQDGSGYGVFGKCYDANGNAVGNEFQINTYITNDQKSPCVAGLTNAGFVVTWVSNGQDGSGYGAYGQVFSAGGDMVGREFRINSYTTSEQSDISLTSLNDGGFVVVWESLGQDSDSSAGIYGQRYNANGEAVGSEFRINTYITAEQSSPRVTSLNDGGFVVTWESNGQDGNAGGIYGQRYDASGNAVSGEFRINTHTASDQSAPCLTALDDGGFVMTWNSLGQDGDVSGVFAQRFNFNKAPVLDNTGNMQLSTILEDNINSAGNTVAGIISSAGGDRITDLNNNGLEGIAITSVENTNGVWEYSLDAGATWCQVDDGSLGNGHALLLASNAPEHMLRFVPNANWYGSASLSFHAWDLSVGAAGYHENASVTGGMTAFSTISETVNIVVSPVNDAPTISAAAASSYTVNAAAMVVDNGIVVTDVDNVNLQGAVVNISSGYSQGPDLLTCTPAGVLTASWDANAASLYIAGSDTVANYQATLRSVRFSSQGNSPSGGRDISFQVYDGALSSVAAEATVSVSQPEEEPPPVVPPPVEPIPVKPPPVEPPPLEPTPVKPTPVEPLPVEPTPVKPPPVEPPPLEPTPVTPPPVEPLPVEPNPAELQPVNPPPAQTQLVSPPDAGAIKSPQEQLKPDTSFMLFQSVSSTSVQGQPSGTLGHESDAGFDQSFQKGSDPLMSGAERATFFSDVKQSADPFAPSEASSDKAPISSNETKNAVEPVNELPGTQKLLPGQEGEKAAEEIKESAAEEKTAKDEQEAAEVEGKVADEKTETTEEGADAKPSAQVGESSSVANQAVKGQPKDQKTAAAKPGELQQPTAEPDKAQAERAEIVKVFDEVYKLMQCN